MCLLVCLVLLLTGKKPEPVTLRVSLYKTLPDYEGFEKKTAECWNEKSRTGTLIWMRPPKRSKRRTSMISFMHLPMESKRDGDEENESA